MRDKSILQGESKNVKSKHLEKGRPSACNKYSYNKTYSHRAYKFRSSDMVC